MTGFKHAYAAKGRLHYSCDSLSNLTDNYKKYGPSTEMTSNQTRYRGTENMPTLREVIFIFISYMSNVRHYLSIF